jgi:hypothetical protein
MGGDSPPGEGMRLRFRVPRDEITRFATALGGAAPVGGAGLAARKAGGGGELKCAADQRWGWISPVEVAGFDEWIPRSATPEGVVVVLLYDFLDVFARLRLVVPQTTKTTYTRTYAWQL